MLNDKRKTKIVDTKTQLFIALEMMGHALILPLLAVIFVTTDPFSTFLSNQSAETHFAAAKDFLFLNINKWPLLVVSILFIGFLSIVFSHHIAGPSYRFIKGLKDLKDKDLTRRIKLRRFDYHQNVSVEFNDLLESLAKEYKNIKNSSEAIAATIEKIADKNPGIKAELDDVVKNAKSIEEIVSQYKTS